jgi:phage baseplate assembly protein W
MSNDSLARLSDPACLAFPFRVGSSGPEVSRGAAHVREQIEQVLFTSPGERVFRPDFGAGVKALVFEPNNRPLWEVTRRRVLATLALALKGEVQASSLDVTVDGREEQLAIVVSYQLVAIGSTQEQRFSVGVTSNG